MNYLKMKLINIFDNDDYTDPNTKVVSKSNPILQFLVDGRVNKSLTSKRVELADIYIDDAKNFREHVGKELFLNVSVNTYQNKKNYKLLSDKPLDKNLADQLSKLDI